MSSASVCAAQVAGERLMDVLAACSRRCTLVDRGDMLSRHLTGACALDLQPSADLTGDISACKIYRRQNLSMNEQILHTGLSSASHASMRYACL